MKARSVILAGLGIILFAVVALMYLVHRSVQSRIGPQHFYSLSEQPAFLTEELAITKARETLKQDRIDVALWHPVSYDLSQAPDGSPDQFFSRNTVNPNQGTIMFTNGGATRFVAITLDGSRLICQISIGK